MKTQRKIKPAKLCYSHLGGKLGELLLEAYMKQGWLAKQPAGKHFYLTPSGEKEFTRLGIDLSQITPETMEETDA